MIMQVIKCDFCGREDRRDMNPNAMANMPKAEEQWHTVVGAVRTESWGEKEEHLCPDCYKRMKIRPMLTISSMPKGDEK